MFVSYSKKITIHVLLKRNWNTLNIQAIKSDIDWQMARNEEKTKPKTLKA